MTELARAVARLTRAAHDVLEVLSPAQALALTRCIEPEPAERARIRVKTHVGTAAALRSAGLVDPLDSERGRRNLTLEALLVLREAGKR